MTVKLSAPQLYFLHYAQKAGVQGYRCPFTGNRMAGRVASAWHRTAASLARRDLVRLQRAGDSQRAFITDAGTRALNDATEGHEP